MINIIQSIQYGDHKNAIQAENSFTLCLPVQPNSSFLSKLTSKVTNTAIRADKPFPQTSFLYSSDTNGIYAWFSTKWSCCLSPTKRRLTMSEDNFACWSRVQGAIGIQWIEWRDAIKDPTMHRRAFLQHKQPRIIWPKMSIVSRSKKLWDMCINFQFVSLFLKM